jgi:general secretion pathway protein A
MYEQFFGLTDKPFALTPNPRYVYYSERYREAEDQLMYAIEHKEGFMLVTGEPGTGKTMLCRDLLDKFDPDTVRSAFLFNPFLNGVEMLATLLTEFGVEYVPTETRKELLDRLNQYLLTQLRSGFQCVAIFDEAQHLSTEFLEQIRVLSNLETDCVKLIQIILVGQPELLERIRTPGMAQLDQRVSVRCSLSQLDEHETDRYIHHRLNVAGARGQLRISDRAVSAIHQASKGVPRVINMLADRTLLAAYVAQTHDVDLEHVRRAQSALQGDDAKLDSMDRLAIRGMQLRSPRAKKIAISVAVVVLVLVAVAFGAPRLRAANSARAEELARLRQDSVTRANSIASAARADSIASAARADSIAKGARADSIASAARAGAASAHPQAAGYAVQVAAFESRAEADASAAALTKRGLSARVVPGAKLFLLHVGHYDTREEARLASLELKARSLPGFVVSSRAP